LQRSIEYALADASFSFDVRPCKANPLRHNKNVLSHVVLQAQAPAVTLVHLPDETVDLVLPVAQVTTLDEVLELSGPEAASRVAQLEGPQEVAGLLEVGPDGVDLVDEILHTDDTVLAKVSLDDSVVGEGNALLVDLAVTTLVHEFTNRLEVGVSVGDVRLNDLQHLEGSLGKTDKDTVVDLEKTEELEDFAGLRGNLVDTPDTNYEDQFGLGRDVERAILLAQAGKTDLLTLCIAVFLDVLLGTLEDDAALLLLSLLLLLKLSRTLLALLLLTLTFLQESLGDEDLVLSWHAPINTQVEMSE